MSYGDFNTNTKFSKGITNREGVGLGPGGSEINHTHPPLPTYSISVKEAPVHQSDVQRTYIGPIAGTGAGSAQASHNEDFHGFSTPTGNKIHINGEAGSESIELIHHTGAAIVIDADGGIFIIPSGKKGFGLNAPKGDGVIAASQRIIIKGSSGVTVETDGNMELNVGGNLHTQVGGDYVLNVHGATTVHSGGTYNVEAVKDLIESVGGIKRATVAGDMRTQVAGSTRVDSGKDIEMRTNMNFKAHAQEGMELLSKTSTSLEVDTGKLQIMAKDDINIASEVGLYLSSKDNVSLDAAGAVSSRSNGNFILSTKGTMFLDADASMDLRGRTTSITGFAGMTLYSANLDVNSTGHMNLHSSAALAITSKQNVDIRGDTAAALQSSGVSSVIGLNTYIDGTGSAQIRSNSTLLSTIPIVLGASSPNSPQGAIAAATAPEIEVADIRNPPGITSPQAAEFPDANTVIDHMTTERVAPDFPHNAKKMNAETFSRYENEGGSPNPKAKAAAQPNQGAGTPTTMGQSAGAIPAPSNGTYDGATNSAVGEKNTFPLPSSVTNSSDKLSNLVTVGMLPGLMHCGATNNGLSRAEILKNAAHLSYNIIDPILRHWGGRVKITDYLRIGSGGSRHYSGKAVDINSSSRNFAETAEVAAWCRDNLAFDRLFLEANHAGTVHMHIEAAPEGQKGARTVWTCADPKCQSKQDGLQLAFAEQGLKKMGFA